MLDESCLVPGSGRYVLSQIPDRN